MSALSPKPDSPPPEPVSGVPTPATRTGTPSQPWSDAGRAETARRLHRKKTRRRQLTRFNEELAEMIVRDMEEEATIGHLVAPIISVAWKALVTGAVLLWYRAQEARGYSMFGMLALIAAAIVAGLAIDPLLRRWRRGKGGDREQLSGSDEGTPESVGLTSLSLRRERADGEQS